ncbi:MAG: hypothetical protein JRN26_07230 [Nitrososphaerota archaeon]|jgi:hypothetical protein|nr:hypothetical protein [Nitrososphaerota archaeon]MDG6927896.1 hypothetical protein [Nitrososphaerota archaeon]MDG6931041.1 hypothetical protein [Nitrososphaerota archaeon]MDG6932099.1 hypothetical protein [Nitrososphaerota archaeon]MDG6936654.1 hypothetical protein [Nitrososphaerota archaeon]
MKNFSIIYDPRLKHVASLLSNLTGSGAYPSSASFSSGERFIVLWSYMGKAAAETGKLKGVIDSLSSVGYVEALLLLPSLHQKDNDIQDFEKEMYKINEVGRVIFFDLTPISKLGVTGKPAINLSAFPILISKFKQMGIRAKVITFNNELLVQGKVIENSIGKSEKDILIIDNFIEDPPSLKPVLMTYFEKLYNVYVFSTYFANDPSPLFPIANVISTNAIPWNGVEAIDIAPSIAEFIKAVA